MFDFMSINDRRGSILFSANSFLLLLHLMSIDFLSFATQWAGDFTPRVGVDDDLTKAKAAFAGWLHGQNGMSPPSSSGIAALPVSWRFGAS